jgi:polyferredoxin
MIRIRETHMTIDKNDAKARTRAKAVRTTLLVLVLVLSTALGILHQVSGVKPVGVDALCPFGGIESAWSVLSSGTLLPRIAWSSFILLGATLLAAILFRRTFCGNFCPLGTLQELFGRLGRKLFGKSFRVPAGLDRWARYLKYGVLGVFVILTAALGTLAIRPYDPWVAYHHLLDAELFVGFMGGAIILLITLLGSLLYDRFFCKYLCPMGAALAPFSKAGLFKIKRDARTCIGCGACDKACPVNLPVSALTVVKDAECLDCDQCVNACPVKDALVIEGPRGRRVSPLVRTLATTGIFLGVLGVATLAGSFSWTMESIAQHTEERGGAFDPSAIKGSDTWENVIRLSGVPKEAFLERFKITEADLSHPIKEKAHAPGSTYDTEAVRAWIKERRH